MAAANHDGSFHILEEFICDAIPAPGIPVVATGRARIEDATMMEELAHDAGAEPGNPLDSAMKVEARRLAALLATAPNPTATAEAFQKLLLAELAGLA